MKQFELQSFTGPDGLKQVNVPAPEPGPREVVMRVHASAINARDLMIANGFFGPLVQAGIVPLSDGAGEVTAIGSDVRRVKLGDRICGTYVDGWISGERLDLGIGRGGDCNGMLSEYVLLDVESVVRLPEHLSFEEGATLPCAAVTAWNAVCGYAPLLPGQTVLTLGSGGVSLFVLQFAKLFGARVIATTSSDAKAERLRSLGADEVINYLTHPNWEQEVFRFTDGEGVDVVAELGGAGTMPKSILSTKRGGRISVVGLLTGAPDSGFGPAFFGRFVRFHHIHVGSRDSFEAMNRAIAYHRLKPIVARTFPFDEAPAAYTCMHDSQHLGKITIRHA
ncbi:NAD(P)-dependent alcohol dehydrogenase [Paraburkholderia phymatum]|uniref:zinc-dependent alcohol dehydrogenase family protein n=1 Tax=Paraburkholderia phymatum TaxID=148447 RepID=UPI003179B753